MFVRETAWAGSFNARDLGGLAVAGGRVRPRVLWRSGQPEAWTAVGFADAARDGVRRVLDLRDSREPRTPLAASQPPREFVTVEDPDDARFRARFQPYLNHPSGYAEFMELFPQQIARAAARVVDAGPGSVVCCSAGRDRTGLVTGLLLSALGASPGALAAEDALATRAVNERHRTRAVPHPYEAFMPPAELDAAVQSRSEAVATWLAGFDPHEWLSAHGVDVDAARPWVVAA